jgi:hypothetical protein
VVPLKKYFKKLNIRTTLKVDEEDSRVSDSHGGPERPVKIGDSSPFGTIHE